jgi:hypothetical protein
MKQIKYKPKPKKCKQCGDLFNPYTTTQQVCSVGCAMEFNSEKEVNKRVKQFKRELRDREWYLNALESVFNAYIRKRDKDLPCISCGCLKANKWDAGHFWAAGNYSFLRFNEDNVHKQCSAYCNVHLSGNQNSYRINLIKKIGAERVQWLDNHRHDKLELSIPEIKTLIEKYKKLCKQL